MPCTTGADADRWNLEDDKSIVAALPAETTITRSKPDMPLNSISGG